MPILIATRGSALALAQANTVLTRCRAEFPDLAFEIKIIKTTGDKLQTASMSRPDETLPRGLFTKELETALLKGRADMAVHSLKDLPTELPPGLKLGGVGGQRQDVRDVLIYRDASIFKNDNARRSFAPKTKLLDFPPELTVATSSTRRMAQLRAARPDFETVEIRGNVATRLEKLVRQPEIDATLLAAAGLARLQIEITAEGQLKGEGIPSGLLATLLEPEEMLPCVGQAAIGIEIRENDSRMDAICARLNDDATFQCVLAERALLRGMGGGCQTPIGAYAQIRSQQLHLRAVSFLGEHAKHVEGDAPIGQANELGGRLAAELK